MNFLGAFIFGFIICFIGQLFIESTSLTNGHLTSLLVVVGAILAFLGIYENFLPFAHAGANIPITSFGNLLYDAAYYGFKQDGFLGMFTNLLSSTSGVISATVFFSFVFMLFTKAKD